MKKQVKKIVIGAAALVFAISGVSLADDGHNRHHKFHKKAYGHHKAKKLLHHRHNKHFKPLRYNHDRYTHREIHHHHHYYYDNYHRRWKSRHLKSKRPHRNRFIYKKAHRYHDNFHRRRALREDQIYKLALRDPAIVFKVILKEHGLY